jgi:hypothetical protein
MPDQINTNGFGLRFKFKDMGDGTYAQVLSAATEGGGGVGDTYSTNGFGQMRRWKDMGDGTFAEVVFVDGLSGLTAAEVAEVRSLANGDGLSKIAPTPPAVLFRFDGAVAKGTGYTVTHTGTGGTDSIDAATSPFIGRNAGPSLKVNAASTRTEVEITGLSVGAWDGHVVVNCSVEDHTGTSLQLQVYAGTTNYGRLFLNTHSVVTGTGANPHNGFHSVPCGPMQNIDVGAGGTPAVWVAGANSTFLPGADTLNAVKIRINGDGVGTRAGAVWIHSITLVPKGRPTVIFTFDDCSASWASNVVPKLNSAGIVGSFGIMAGAIGTNNALYLTAAQLKALSDAGHETYSHNLVNTALASPYGAAESDTYAAAFKGGFGALAAVVGSKASTLYHPWVQGISSDFALKRLRSHGCRIARMASASRHNIIAAAPGGGQFDQIMQLRPISITTNGGQMTTAGIDQIVSDCAKYGTTVVLMLHEVQDAPSTSIETSVAIFNYLVDAFVGNAAIAKRSIWQFWNEAVAEGLV